MDKMIMGLPLFMQEYPDIQAICEAEAPEFEGYEEAYTQAINDNFLYTASEARIYQYELMLDILPVNELSLEERQNRLNTFLMQSDNYDLYSVIEEIKKISLSRSVAFQLWIDTYRLFIRCDMPAYLWDMYSKKLQAVVPANIVLEAENAPTHIINGACGATGGITRDYYRRID